jgi:ribosome-binding protein aMBF1 (putative translation factor)
MATASKHSGSAVTEFVAMVKAALEEQGMTITDLAKKAKVGRPYLHRVLSGEHVPTMERAEKIGKPLGLKVRTVST